MHLLELKDDIALSDSQVREIQALFDDMKREAMVLGAAYVDAERALDRAFAAQDISPDALAGRPCRGRERTFAAGAFADASQNTAAFVEAPGRHLYALARLWWWRASPLTRHDRRAARGQTNGRKRSRGLVAISAALMLVVGVPGATLFAHEGATGVVKQRMADMKSFAAAIKKLAPILRGSGPWDSAAVAAQAAIIEDRAGKHIPMLFPEGTDGSPSDAAPLIWFEAERFAAQAETLRERAAALRESAAGAEGPDDAGSGVSPASAFANLADSCRSCHQTYRLRR